MYLGGFLNPELSSLIIAFDDISRKLDPTNLDISSTMEFN